MLLAENVRAAAKATEAAAAKATEAATAACRIARTPTHGYAATREDGQSFGANTRSPPS